MRDESPPPPPPTQPPPTTPPPRQEPPQIPPESTRTPPEPPQGQGDASARSTAALIHVLAIFFFFIGPLVLWILKREDDPFIDQQGRETMNWEITAFIVWMLSWIIGVTIGFGLLPIVWIAKVVFNVIGAIKSSEGQPFRYPFAIRLLR